MASYRIIVTFALRQEKEKTTMIESNIIYPIGYSFIKKSVVCKQFPSRWHYHKEFELLRISSGFGKRFVGNSVDDFNEGDIVLVGGNIPHFLLSNAIFYEENDLFCKSEVIQFTHDIFPEKMENMPEFLQIVNILEKSAQGILFQDQQICDEVHEQWVKMEKLAGLSMLTSLYHILHLLSLCKQIKILSKGHFTKQYSDNNTPVSRAYEYLINNFKHAITLNEIAQYAGQNNTALCRSFKKSTGKNIFEVLIEIRIEFACKFLTNTDFPVTEIAYNSGFQNISHFNHTFKKQTTLSPVEYRKNTTKKTDS